MVAGTAAVDKGAGTSEEIPTGLAAFASVPVAGSSTATGDLGVRLAARATAQLDHLGLCTRRIGERSSRSSPVCHGLHDGHPFRAMSPDRDVRQGGSSPRPSFTRLGRHGSTRFRWTRPSRGVLGPGSGRPATDSAEPARVRSHCKDVEQPSFAPRQ